jgi:hypothetical protein
MCVVPNQVLFMLKTDPEDPRYVEHFKGKQRLFEMQIQGCFKKLPDGASPGLNDDDDHSRMN